MTKFRKETELGPDSIQKWCEELDSKEKCEMPQDDAVILLKILINEKNINNDPNFKNLLTGWNATAIIHNRIKQFHTFTANNAVLMFLGCMIESPGIAVEYCNYMQYKCWQRGIKHIDMETFSRYISLWDFSAKKLFAKCGINRKSFLKTAEVLRICSIIRSSWKVSEK